MDNNQKKYRVPSARAQWWDYSWAAAYFITICTKNKAHYFGQIYNQKMHLSQVGVLADVFWHEIPKHFNTVELGAFVIMPNHMHGLLIIHSSENSGANPETEGNIGASRFQNQGKKTVSAMVGSYKAAVTRHANRLGFEFAWQSRFYDHIVRNDTAYQRISDYIESNPRNWENDILLSSSLGDVNPETTENIGASRFQNQGKKTISAMVRNDAICQRISDYIESKPLNLPNKTIPS